MAVTHMLCLDCMDSKCVLSVCLQRNKWSMKAALRSLRAETTHSEKTRKKGFKATLSNLYLETAPSHLWSLVLLGSMFEQLSGFHVVNKQSRSLYWADLSLGRSNTLNTLIWQNSFSCLSNMTRQGGKTGSHTPLLAVWKESFASFSGFKKSAYTG